MRVDPNLITPRAVSSGTTRAVQLSHVQWIPRCVTCALVTVLLPLLVVVSREVPFYGTFVPCNILRCSLIVNLLINEVMFLTKRDMYVQL